MSEYTVEQVYRGDKRTLAEVKSLLEEEGITLDANLDYTCVMRDSADRIIATGSCFHNTLRCFAVSHIHQGEGLLNEIITHLIQYEADRGNLHLFLYTKIQSAKFFSDLGFYEIARVADTLVFMENRKDGFASSLEKWKNETRKIVKELIKPGSEQGAVEQQEGAGERAGQAEDNLPASAAIVMNANPFTNGHRYLVEQAVKDGKLLHLFVVSEDASLVPFAVRKRLIEEGTKAFPNIIIHDSGPYIISNATFPSYFLKDEKSVIAGQARLDLAVFQRIAKALHITTRYAGEEKSSEVTALYNKIMQEELPKAQVALQVIPRKEEGGAPISASTVRSLIQAGEFSKIKSLVPPSTYVFFVSEEGKNVIKKIQEAKEVVHY